MRRAAPFIHRTPRITNNRLIQTGERDLALQPITGTSIAPPFWGLTAKSRGLRRETLTLGKGELYFDISASRHLGIGAPHRCIVASRGRHPPPRLLPAIRPLRNQHGTRTNAEKQPSIPKKENRQPPNTERRLFPVSANTDDTVTPTRPARPPSVSKRPNNTTFGQDRQAFWVPSVVSLNV